MECNIANHITEQVACEYIQFDGSMELLESCSAWEIVCNEVIVDTLMQETVSVSNIRNLNDFASTTSLQNTYADLKDMFEALFQ